MDLWLQKVGKMKAPEALQRDVLKIMESLPGYEEQTEWLKSSETTMSELAVLTYLINDGLVIMSPDEDNTTEAVHLQNCISKETLNACMEESRKENNDELTLFEKELHELTVDDE